MPYYFLLLILPFLCLHAADEQLIEPDETLSYMIKRSNWLEKDSKASFSSNIHLSDAEKKLDNYLQTFCYHFWNHFLESNLFPPSKYFSDAKLEIEKSPLFRILKRMPKGGVLHIHSDSTGNAAFLIKKAMSDKRCYIYTQDDGSELKGTMKVFLNEIPQGYQSMQELAAKDSNFVSSVIEMITMNATDTASVNPWVKFNQCFHRCDGLLLYEPIFKDFYINAFETIALDHIYFVELRTSLDPIRNEHGQLISDNALVDIYRSIVQKVREKYPLFTLKLIVSDLRSQTLSEANKSLERAYKLLVDNPDMIVGYDLVGFETTGHSLLYYLDNLLLSAKDYEFKYGVTLPYFFHAGESGWGHDKNPYDAVLLKSKRIGHGFNLVHFPNLMQEIKKQNICIEICPISNQVLGYVKDLRIHPAVGYLKQGVPCIISSDDPMLFKTYGLTYDFWEAIMAWNLSLADIKQLCMNSILYSSLSDEEKSKMLEHWNKEWTLFVRHILADLHINN